MIDDDLSEYQEKLVYVARTHDLECIVHPFARRIHKLCMKPDRFDGKLAWSLASNCIMLHCEEWSEKQ